MTISLLLGRDDEIKQWASEKLGNINFDLSVAIGIVDDNNLIAAVVYHDYKVSPYGEPILIEMSIVSISTKWCSRSILQQIFAYPFNQLRVKRVQATCSENNVSVRKFLSRLGFQFEGIGREAWHLGGNCASYSLLKNECKWLNYGQKRRLLSSPSS